MGTALKWSKAYYIMIFYVRTKYFASLCHSSSISPFTSDTVWMNNFHDLAWICSCYQLAKSVDSDGKYKHFNFGIFRSRKRKSEICLWLLYLPRTLHVFRWLVERVDREWERVGDENTYLLESAKQMKTRIRWMGP